MVDLPLPLPPSTTVILPGTAVRSTPRSTSRLPNFFWTRESTATSAGASAAAAADGAEAEEGAVTGAEARRPVQDAKGAAVVTPFAFGSLRAAPRRAACITPRSGGCAG